MAGHAFLTIDTELMWRHHRAGLAPETLYQRSLEPAGVGLAYQLAVLERHRLKACFFIDPMPALAFGIDPVRRMVDTILTAGQEVQLHLHPQWVGARADDRGAAHGEFELIDFDLAGQRRLIEQARSLLIEAGAPDPIAFRAGSYSANDDTLRALAQLGFTYDSSHNGAQHPWPSAIDLPVNCITPVERLGVVEVPVTVIEEAAGRLRHFQICALSSGEMAAALDHAIAQDHAAVTMVGHGFELATRAGTRVNRVHRRRFDDLCAMLDARRDQLPTAWFADQPAMPLDSDARPLSPRMLRTRWRQVEQAWSNLVSEQRL